MTPGTLLLYSNRAFYVALTARRAFIDSDQEWICAMMCYHNDFIFHKSSFFYQEEKLFCKNWAHQILAEP